MIETVGAIEKIDMVPHSKKLTGWRRRKQGLDIQSI